MSYRVTIERVPGFPASRETFTVTAKNQIACIDVAECRRRLAGSLAEIVNVARV